MLRLHNKKRMVLSAVTMAVILIPAMVLAISKIVEVQNTSAITYPIPSGYTTITDPNFYDCVATEFVEEYPGEEIPSTGLTDEQLGKITKLGCSGNGKNDDEKIINMIGLEKMVGLTNLDVSYNKISSIDVSNNTLLMQLLISHNQLTSLDVSHNTVLGTLSADSNQLTSLDVSNNEDLINLRINSNKLTSLNVANNTALKRLWAGWNQITSLDVSGATALIEFEALGNKLTSLDISNNSALEKLDVQQNQFSSFDVSNNTKLVLLNIQQNQLTSFDVSNNLALETFRINDNQLTSLDVSNNVALEVLFVNNNRLTFLDVSNNGNLRTLGADDILIRANISPTALAPNLTYDCGGLGFLSGSHTIYDTDYYTYDNDGAVLTVNNYIGTSGYAQVQYPGSVWFSYKLQLPIFATFNANGGVGEHEMQSCYPNLGETTCSITLPNTAPTRSNYFFLGWADSADATSAAYALDSSVTLDGPKALYAIWAPVRTLTFDANGGSNAPSAKTCHANTTNGSCTVTVPSTVPTRNNYTFLGYADSASASSASSNYEAGKTVTLSSNKTIYAVWKIDGTDPTPDPDPDPTPGPGPDSGPDADSESGNEGSSQGGGKNGIIAVPNTGETTANFDNINVVYCILFAVLMVGLGAGFYVYRNKKAHRKFEW